MKLVSVLTVAALGASAVGASSLKAKARADSNYISTSLKFEQTLRVCNAYPYQSGGVNVLGKTLAYKNCLDITQALKKNMQIDFYAPDKSVLIGSFEISELPDNDATLFLLIQAHDALSTGVKFQSHVYSNSPDAQVALFDSYVGAKVGTKNLLTISDLQNQKDAASYQPRNEDLLFNTVVAVHPGDYEVFVAGHEKTKRKLHAGQKGKYSVVRVGVVQGEKGNAQFPEELIVFPSSAFAQGANVLFALAASVLSLWLL